MYLMCAHTYIILEHYLGSPDIPQTNLSSISKTRGATSPFTQSKNVTLGVKVASNCYDSYYLL